MTRKAKSMIQAGMQLGRWTVQDTFQQTERGERKWLCRCSCGVERYVLERSLKAGSSQSCGCLNREKISAVSALSLEGKTFGELTVLRADQERGADGSLRWVCRCSCGQERVYPGSLLNTGRKTHCGCKSKQTHNYADIEGRQFHRLTALQRLDTRDSAGYCLWRCRCECGNYVDVSYNALMYGSVKSCGCRKKEHDQELRGYLTHVAGTAVEKLKSSKIPRNNTTGVKGVYFIKGKYVAKMVFQNKQYYLGAFKSLEDAAEARREAEEQINDTVVAYYERWKRRAEQDPVWEKNNPLRIEVERDARNHINVLFQPALKE